MMVSYILTEHIRFFAKRALGTERSAPTIEDAAGNGKGKRS